MMKGRTSNTVPSNRSTKNGRRDQKPQKKSGAKISSEQERLKPLEAKEESKVFEAESVTTAQASEVAEKQESVNGLVKDVDDDDDKRADHLVEEVQEDASDNDIGSGSEKEASEDEEALKQKVESLETRIEKLEEELREVASLEISLYSVVPDHSSSAHKLHTPARRVSRLYIHACKHWSQEKRATVARNTVSGLIFAAKSCGNDVSRLTFWLSNVVTLREITSHAFGSEHTGSEKLKRTNGFKLDWHEPETFTAALEKVESWIFSRIVESVWWQVFTPHMQPKMNEKLMGDQEKGSFSISLWQNAFNVALSRLCPMRGEGHECGCLPILSKMVMEKCIARVDVAMFNAILRESEHQIPTDPVSDPILDSKVLPITAGDLSFGSGAQLKNAIGNWCRCLAEDSVEEDEKYFSLLNQLSDLLMLPKDMLMDLSVREEVCPSISLPLIKRILCNFTPDEFCPDHVPGAVLEELNTESISDQKLSGVTFPYAASPLTYIPPSSTNVAEKIKEVGGDISRMSRNASVIQRKGYTSDEELDELDSPLTFVIDKVYVSLSSGHNGKVKQKDGEEVGEVVANVRYELLREVWSM
ncbi:nucleolar protein gar2-related [Raphanus sativus]|uniref:Uncharacterized protein LOC108833702 n=1 Tax=Raphanus sativus TaxID=3726 RepID=A0A6J0LRI3_RAPSA|nr:uncharacterized protein LOC108833702 [Raphanus sativus]XP_018462611.1 uncharacterized protein LOC108833702 [Raphanus sativus]XP_018462612.1 uncharacterized protein LOC108833702 [Raphanus sativus]KAJ4904890.1 nucleolar protein gar2-related [Raphanus sativus]